MDTCPYCGEEVPADSQSCWKCGVELTGGGTDAPDGDDGAPPTIELRGEAAEPRAPQSECPYCGEPVAGRALRCNACGRVLRRGGGGLDWARAVWVAFGLVLAATVAGLVYSKVASHEYTDPRRKDPLDASYSNLARIYLRDVPERVAMKLEGTWEEEHVGRYVEWEGAITRVVDSAEGVIELADSGLAVADDPEVRVTLERPGDVEKRGLKRGKLIKYSAQLVEFRPEEGIFVLENGLVRDD